MKSIKKAVLMILTVCLAVGSAISAYAADGFVFTYNNVDYTPGMDAKTAMNSLGAASSSRDVNNCANGYINKAYIYGQNDFELYIEQVDGKEAVVNITLMSGNVSTNEGLKPGEDEARVTAVYPDAVKGLGKYTVTRENTKLEIKIINGKISYISYMTVN